MKTAPAAAALDYRSAFELAPIGANQHQIDRVRPRHQQDQRGRSGEQTFSS